MYKDKIQNYQGDCAVILGKHRKFSDYIREFAETIPEGSKGLDIGAGPKGCNSVFFTHCQLDGCDAEPEVVTSLDETNNYKNKFQYFFGREDPLPYTDNSLDFVVCSCMIQHLNSFTELERGITEVSRVLKGNVEGRFYLMFKVGTNDTDLVHTNRYYNQERRFRVFMPEDVSALCQAHNMVILRKEFLLDDNYIPYCLLVLTKK